MSDWEWERSWWRRKRTICIFLWDFRLNFLCVSSQLEMQRELFSAATDINKKMNEKKRRKRKKRKTTYWFLTGIWSCGTPFAVYENTAGLIFCSKSIFIWVIFFPSFFSLLFFSSSILFCILFQYPFYLEHLMSFLTALYTKLNTNYHWNTCSAS